MTKATVHLYGLGNIGFRHLQGLKPLTSSIVLVCIDPSAERLALADAEWTGEGATAAPGRAPQGASVAVLATSARGRLDLLKQVVGDGGARHVVLEKVVFTTEEDFEAAERLLESANVKAWVNCPRRQWPLYRDLRERLAGRGPFRLTHGGADWGLACNGVHFVDLLQFLAGTTDVALEQSEIEQIIPAKRAGYHEVLGALTVRAGENRLKLSAATGDPIATTIEGQGWRWRVHEGSGQVIDEASGEIILDVGRPPFQSELTAALVEPLLADRAAPVASLTESRGAHRVIIEALLPAFETRGHDVSKGLPIT